MKKLTITKNIYTFDPLIIVDDNAMGLYKGIIRPMLFSMNIESAHRFAIVLLRVMGMLPFGMGRKMLRRTYCVEHESLVREVFGVRFSNPVGLAAGFDVNGEVVNELGDLGFGFVEVGAVSPEPREGNPKPRVFRLVKDRAIVQRMGMPNRGLQYMISNLRRRNPNIVVGCNIAKNSGTQIQNVARDYLKSFRNLYQYVDYFTVYINYSNLICDDKTTPVMAITNLLMPLIEFRRGQSDYRPIMVKVTPDLSDEMIDAVTQVLISTPLDGVVATSGTYSREGLQVADSSVIRVGTGRLSGEPIRARSLDIVRRIYDGSGGAYPIIGVGGISTAEDVQDMLDAGASLVQIYSSFIYEGPRVVGDICHGLIEEEHDADSVAPLSEL